MCTATQPCRTEVLVVGTQTITLLKLKNKKKEGYAVNMANEDGSYFRAIVGSLPTSVGSCGSAVDYRVHV